MLRLNIYQYKIEKMVAERFQKQQQKSLPSKESSDHSDEGLMRMSVRFFSQRVSSSSNTVQAHRKSNSATSTSVNGDDLQTAIPAIELTPPPTEATLSAVINLDSKQDVIKPEKNGQQLNHEACATEVSESTEDLKIARYNLDLFSSGIGNFHKLRIDLGENKSSSQEVTLKKQLFTNKQKEPARWFKMKFVGGDELADILMNNIQCVSNSYPFDKMENFAKEYPTVITKIKTYMDNISLSFSKSIVFEQYLRECIDSSYYVECTTARL